MNEPLVSAYTLSEMLGDHIKECEEEARKLAELVTPADELKYDMLHKCLTAFSLARAFYSDSFGWKPPEDCKDPLSTGLLRKGEMAKLFRAVLRRIGMGRLNYYHPSHRVIEQAQTELESCERWLKRKGLRGWLVRRYDASADRPTWSDVAPRDFIHQILMTISEADKCRKRLQEEQKKKEKESKK